MIRKQNQFPELQTDRLHLRQFSAADQERIFRGLSHPEVIRYYGISFDSLEATQEQVEWYATLEKEQKGIWWALWEKSSDTFIGAGGYHDWDHTNRNAEIGFWLLPEFWGKGFMQDAMPRICQYAFTHMHLHRIVGYVDSENANCRKAMAKLQFQHEGTLQDCELKNGRFISLEIYAKLATDSV